MVARQQLRPRHGEHQAQQSECEDQLRAGVIERVLGHRCARRSRRPPCSAPSGRRLEEAPWPGCMHWYNNDRLMDRLHRRPSPDGEAKYYATTNTVKPGRSCKFRSTSSPGCFMLCVYAEVSIGSECRCCERNQARSGVLTCRERTAHVGLGGRRSSSVSSKDGARERLAAAS